MTLSALWVYQKERFPLIKTAPLLAVFSAASLSVSAGLADRPLPDLSAFGAGFAIAMLLFFQMRVCDEYKDQEDDRRFRPHRPIPRGLVSLRLILALGAGSLPLTALVAWLWHPPVLWLLALVWAWLALMTAEFGVAAWLKARPVLYLLSHMAIMPLIDLLLTGLEWLPAADVAPALWLFLALSFVNGCVLEIGRKLWAPQNEIDGVETYSALWGPPKAAMIWAIFVGLSLALLVGLCATMGAGLACLLIGGIGAATCWALALRYSKAPTPPLEKRLDTAAGLWVFACYTIAGIAPYLGRVL
jgi:4-hydroxybenzoate polyprenyltransferase